MVKWQRYKGRDQKGRYTSGTANPRKSFVLGDSFVGEIRQLKLQVWVLTWLLPYVVAARTHPQNRADAMDMYQRIKEDMCNRYSAFPLKLSQRAHNHGYMDMHATVERLVSVHDQNHGSSRRVSSQAIMLGELDIEQWIQGEKNRRPRMIPLCFKNPEIRSKLLIWCCFLFNTSNRTVVAKLQLSVQWTADMGYDVFCTQDWASSKQEDGGKQLNGWLVKSPLEFGVSQIYTRKGVRALLGPVSLLNGACAQCAQFRGLPGFGRVQDIWPMLKNRRLPTNREILTVWYGVNYAYFVNNNGECFKNDCDFNKLSTEDEKFKENRKKKSV